MNARDAEDDLPHRAFAHPLLGPLFLAVGCSAAIAFGFAGIGRGGGFADSAGDMHFLVAAGTCWWRRLSPYNLDAFVETVRSLPELGHGPALDVGFAYPPQSAPLCMLLASMPLAAARIVMASANVASMGVLAHAIIQLSRSSAHGARDASLRWFVPALVAVCPFTQHVLYMGQTSLLAAALVFAGWHAALDGRRPSVAGLLLGAATIKPQVVFLPLVWLALRGKWKPLGFAAVVALGFCAWPFATIGPVRSLVGWAHAARYYAAGPVQAAGFRHVFSFQSLLVSAGIRVPSLALVAIVAVGLMWWQRRRFREEDIAGLLVAFSFLFIYAHDYDLVALIPLLVALWARMRGRTGATLLLCAAIAVLFVPQRLMHEDWGPLLHWREVVFAILTTWLVAETVRAPPPPVEAPP